MSQHCRANPCCGDVPCSGAPMPQDASGIVAHNETVGTVKSLPTFAAIMGVTEEATEELVSTFVEAAKVFNAKLNGISEGLSAMSRPQIQAWAAYLESRIGEAQEAVSEIISQ